MRISDWSSDVCSSDLDNFHRCPRSTKWRRGSHGALGKNPHDCRLRCAPECYLRAFARLRRHERRKPPQRGAVPGLIGSGRAKIGRRSCWERECQDGEISEVAGREKQKKTKRVK